MRKSIQNIIFAKSKEWLIEKIHRSSEGGYGEVLCDTDRVRWRQIIRCGLVSCLPLCPHLINCFPALSYLLLCFTIGLGFIALLC